METFGKLVDDLAGKPFGGSTVFHTWESAK